MILLQPDFAIDSSLSQLLSDSADEFLQTFSQGNLHDNIGKF